MFKRLAKSKRHSVEGVCGDPRPSPGPLTTTPPPSPTSLITPSGDILANVRSARAPRAKQARRSCGDQPLHRVMQPFEKYADEHHDADHQAPRVTRVNTETDYQMVTAVPAYIVEHEPEKQKGLGVWGRRMSKKIDSFRRSSCRDALLPAEPTPEKPRTQGLDTRRFSSPPQRSASPFKSFFIRMGSTGMLNSAKSNRRSLQSVEDGEPITGKTTTGQGTGLRSSRSPEKDQAPLFRSCSTSQLNTTPTYVKGDDPSEGIDLRMSGKDNNKTVSCDNLAGQLMDDVFEPAENSSTTTSTFSPCDFGDTHRELHLVRKSVSCEFREPRESRDPKDAIKKTNFPYAFLRSKLSVLPEEKHGTTAGFGATFTNSVSKQSPEDRLFKTVSEEHFPSLLRVDDGTETTTLGRRRSRPGGSAAFLKPGGRNSYSEYRSPSYDQERHISGSISSVGGHDRVDFGIAAGNDYADLEAAATSSIATATLRSQRRNSAPSAEQRLSSHYVSSNESGYDSDGPRGESAAASEAEALSLNRADSSDTSSVVDSEMEKPTRSSTPSEYTDQTEGIHVHVHHHHHHQGHQGLVQNTREEVITVENGLEGLRWHQTTSGRILPSINQISGTESDHPGERESRENSGASTTNLASPHRVRLQQDKTRFLSDIIQPAERVRRCRLVNLTKTDPAESLGIRLAQQMSERHVRYVVVELENKGIAHRDGRLRLGDEIVEVEGRDLGTLESLQAVQEFLASFRGKKVQLLTAYDESVPQVCNGALQGLLPGETEYLENAKTLSNISLCDDQRRVIIQEKNSHPVVATEQRKRPDYLPLTSSNVAASETSSADILLEAHRCLTRHVARFEKGYGKPSLGFSVVGGRDSPRGEMGIFVRRVFPGGQADVSKSLLQGDEITTLNGKILRGYTHREVIELFKAVREGPVELEIARRHRYPKSVADSATY